jgi:ferredoxin
MAQALSFHPDTAAERSPLDTGVFEMSYKIIASQCTNCGACEFECPNQAISFNNETYVIDPQKCTECEGDFEHPQCDTVCPVENTCVPA